MYKKLRGLESDNHWQMLDRFFKNWFWGYKFFHLSWENLSTHPCTLKMNSPYEYREKKCSYSSGPLRITTDRRSIGGGRYVWIHSWYVWKNFVIFWKILSSPCPREKWKTPNLHLKGLILGPRIRKSKAICIGI